MFSIFSLATSSVALAISFQGSPDFGFTWKADGGNKFMFTPKIHKYIVYYQTEKQALEICIIPRNSMWYLMSQV